MLRRAVKMVVIVACLATVARAEVSAGKKPSAEPSAIQGLWRGFWGGGEANGVVMLPAMAELFVEGNVVRMRGFPKVGSVDGKLRVDERNSKIVITPQAKAAGQPAAKIRAARRLAPSGSLSLLLITPTGAGSRRSACC